MAQRQAHEERLLQRYWEKPVDHRQCMKNVLTRIEAGDLNQYLQRVGVPPSATRDKFECKYLNKRSDSNPTYHVKYQDKRQTAQFVVRMKPPNVEYENLHRVCLEAEVMKTLKGLGLPVPQVYHIEPCPEFIGTEFFIMEYVEGCTITDYSMRDLTPQQRTQVFHSVAEALAQLHSLPIPKSLEDLLNSKEKLSTTKDCWNFQVL